MTYIVVATPEEVKLKTNLLQFSKCPVIITGVGATNVIRALNGLSRDSFLVNIGYAGSVDLEIGEMVEVGTVRLHHEVSYSETPALIGCGVECYTSNDFVTSSSRKGCVFDMELAYICAMGFANVQAYKVISDHCDYKEYENMIHK